MWVNFHCKSQWMGNVPTHKHIFPLHILSSKLSFQKHQLFVDSQMFTYCIFFVLLTCILYGIQARKTVYGDANSWKKHKQEKFLNGLFVGYINFIIRHAIFPKEWATGSVFVSKLTDSIHGSSMCMNIDCDLKLTRFLRCKGCWCHLQRVSEVSVCTSREKFGLHLHIGHSIWYLLKRS